MVGIVDIDLEEEESYSLGGLKEGTGGRRKGEGGGLQRNSRKRHCFGVYRKRKTKGDVVAFGLGAYDGKKMNC